MKRLIFAVIFCLLVSSSAWADSVGFMYRGSGAAGFCTGSEAFCDSFNSCTAAAEPDGNCEESWTVAGTDEYLVTADAGDSGSGDKAVVYVSTGATNSMTLTGFTINDGDTITYKFKVVGITSAKVIDVDLKSGATVAIRFQLKGSATNVFTAQYFDGAVYQPIQTGLVTGTWYTLVISDLNFTNDTADFAVGGGSVNDAVNWGNVAGIDTFLFRYGNQSGDSIVYDDVAGYNL